MRTRFEQQFSIGHRLFEDMPTNPKRKGKLEELIVAMKPSIAIPVITYCGTVPENAWSGL